MSGWTWHLQRIFGENIFMLFAFSKTQTHTCTYMLSMAMIQRENSYDILKSTF